MTLRLNTLEPILVQWVKNTTGITTVWANQKQLRPHTYPYNVMEVMSFESEVGSSTSDLIYTIRVGDDIVRCRESYKLLTINIQALAGEVSENSLDALDVLSDALKGLQDAVERAKLTSINMIPVSWGPTIPLTGIQHHEFISRASVDVMFRVSDTVTETLDRTETIIADTEIGDHMGTVTATDT